MSVKKRIDARIAILEEEMRTRRAEIVRLREMRWLLTGWGYA